jgi:lipoprotein-releasing system permease protein
MNRTLIWQLAWRYVRGKRSANAVPLLSRISMAAIAVGSGAMIVIFSVFNGLEYLVKDLYKAFYPEIKISAAKGKFFDINPSQLTDIKHVQGVKAMAGVIQDDAFVNNGKEQIVVTIVGADSNYFRVNDISPYIIAGADSLVDYPAPTAIVGKHIANIIGVDADNAFSTITINYPNSKATDINLDPASLFQSLTLKANGEFEVQDEFDSKYVLAPLPLVQTLFQEEGHYSSIQLALNSGADEDRVKSRLQRLLGNTYKVETRFEQNKTLYMAMHAEKWMTYATLLFVLLIASFNMVGALSMLVLEKEKDIAILKAMGVQSISIRRIFQLEGLLWALTGGFTGLVLGAGLCLGQQHYKWVKMGGSFIVDAYPVNMQLTDFLLVICTIITVGLLAAWYPAYRATKALMTDLKSA